MYRDRRHNLQERFLEIMVKRITLTSILSFSDSFSPAMGDRAPILAIAQSYRIAPHLTRVLFLGGTFTGHPSLVAAARIHDEFSGSYGHMPIVLIWPLNGFCGVLIYSSCYKKYHELGSLLKIEIYFS